MRRARFTYIGAFHHVMNRGLNGTNIFPRPEDKSYFLSILLNKSKFYKIKILAYCIMSNHYHIILQNTSGKLSDFMKQLNGIYGTYFRKKYGGQGYVFQNRFKSTLIQEGKYLINSIIYTLLNPVRAGMVKSPEEYKWSSINDSSFSKSIIDTDFLNQLIGKSDLLEMIHEIIHKNKKVELYEKNCRYGKIIGEDSFVKEAMQKGDRRKRDEAISLKRRKNEKGFKKYQEIIEEFELKEGIKIEEIDFHTKQGKKIRIKLLVKLREEGCMRYSEINKINIFQTIRLESLSVMYNRWKKQLKVV